MRLEIIECRGLRESWESQSRAGRYNPATVVKFDGRRHVLPVGTGDDWQLYRIAGEAERVYCVSVNRSYGYCGVQAYDAADQEPCEELGVFFQGEASEEIGDIDNLTDRTIARRLISHLCEVTA
jgi:hypothetical protein